MIDCEILAGGFLSGFITGKYYNRCKKLHALLSLALQILHWRQFLNTIEMDVSESTRIHRALKEIPSSRLAVNELLRNAEVIGKVRGICQGYCYVLRPCAPITACRDFPRVIDQ